PSPTVLGGAAPVTIACTPGSGALFPVGTTSVSCTARDARQHLASCSFLVSIMRLPQLAATRFLAYGDSITAGELDTLCGSTTTFGLGYLEALQNAPRVFDPGRAYPTKLQSLLAARYTAQTITIVNAGLSAERA